MCVRAGPKSQQILRDSICRVPSKSDLLTFPFLVLGQRVGLYLPESLALGRVSPLSPQAGLCFNPTWSVTNAWSLQNGHPTLQEGSGISSWPYPSCFGSFSTFGPWILLLFGEGGTFIPTFKMFLIILV